MVRLLTPKPLTCWTTNGFRRSLPTYPEAPVTYTQSLVMQSYIHTNTGHQLFTITRTTLPGGTDWPSNLEVPEKCHQRNLHGQSSKRSVTREICTARTRSGPNRRGRQAGTPNTPTAWVRFPIHWPQAEPSAHTHTYTHVYTLSPAAPVRPQAPGSRGLYFCLMTLSAASQIGNAAVTGCQGPR